MLASTPFESADDVYNWISGFINFEKRHIRQEYRLDRMLLLAEAAGRPERCAPAFHVAGSKGKGSVTGMITAILEASGIKTARYASPHVSDFRERIALGSAFFDEGLYAQAGQELAKLVEGLHASAGAYENVIETTTEATFFELFTLWFFLCARLARCDAMAVETGLGGRLDATNILDPLVSVISLIELEHTEYLGNTIAEIAGEKAGIIKPGRPLVLAEQCGEALEVFSEHTARKESPLFYFPDCTELRDVRLDKRGTFFTLALKAKAGRVASTYRELFVPMPGEVQAKNAGLAVLAVKTAFPDIQEGEIREGLAGFSLPARFERVQDKPLLVLDGAHTKRSVDICLKTFASLYGAGGILIFGCAAGKDVFSMAELCVSSFSKIIITRPGTFKESFPEEVYAAFEREAGKLVKAPELLFIPQAEEALDRALCMALELGLPILGTGSFYLAGEIRKRFLN